MESDAPFDYQGRAEQARKAAREFKSFIQGELHILHSSSNEEPTDEAYERWGEFKKTSEYQDFLNAFWEAFRAAVPPGFDEELEELSHHTSLKALEMAVSFLEADPYFFWSGFMKQKLLRRVRGYALAPEYVSRLENVILKVVDSHYCREFREYRKLAHRLDSTRLRLALQDRTRSEDPHIRNRAHWVLDWLEGLQASSEVQSP